MNIGDRPAPPPARARVRPRAPMTCCNVRPALAGTLVDGLTEQIMDLKTRPDAIAQWSKDMQELAAQRVEVGRPPI